MAFSLLGTNFIWSRLIALLNSDHYSELYLKDEGYSITTMIFYGVLLLLLLIFSGKYRRMKIEESRIIIGMSTLAFTFQAFALVSSAAFRLSYYFIPYLLVGLPNSFNYIENAGIKRPIKLIVAFIVVFFFVYSNRNGGSVVPYKFFWQ